MCPGDSGGGTIGSIGGAIGGGAIGSIGGGWTTGGGGGAAMGGGGRYGLPRHAASAGMDMHCGSSGPVGGPGGAGGAGGPTQYGPPIHAAYPGFCRHRGSSGPVGRSVANRLSNTGVPGVAFTGASVGIAAVIATAADTFVIAVQMPTMMERVMIPPFSRTPQPTLHYRQCGQSHSAKRRSRPGIRRVMATEGRPTAGAVLGVGVPRARHHRHAWAAAERIVFQHR